MRALVLEHQRDAPAGLVEVWAAARDIALDVCRPAEGEPWPAPGEHDAVIALGSDRSVERSRDAWIAAELGFLQAAHEAQIPVLGLCFGGQALAAALGGRVGRAAHAQIGWGRVQGARRRLRGPVLPLS